MCSLDAGAALFHVEQAGPCLRGRVSARLYLAVHRAAVVTAPTLHADAASCFVLFEVGQCSLKVSLLYQSLW